MVMEFTVVLPSIVTEYSLTSPVNSANSVPATSSVFSVFLYHIALNLIAVGFAGAARLRVMDPGLELVPSLSPLPLRAR